MFLAEEAIKGVTQHASQTTEFRPFKFEAMKRPEPLSVQQATFELQEVTSCFPIIAAPKLTLRSD
ncbi:hypothetical protein DVJ83_02580 [Deinococcus wulumuqiensis]|uniref:Uncharacterized protein n=1 Tax=Deinococcus wulumuqiensis TaxID=980427 RepID=A0A345IEV3_9DEIO|nr:hypothetical protein DVJ83_02580 [Deinococcus wulumuqiensis]